MNPYDRNNGFKAQMPSANSDAPPTSNDNVFNAMQTTDKPQQAGSSAVAKPQKVSFPPHLFIPDGAESIDIRRVVDVPAATVNAEIFSFTAPRGAVTRFIQYGIFNDGALASNYNFLPLVEDSRAFRYHGDPTDNYRIYLGLGPDLSNTSMINCQMVLQPDQTIRWFVTNSSGVNTAMGVRMVGYLDTSQRVVPARFG
jgi:hypothetical protein